MSRKRSYKYRPVVAQLMPRAFALREIRVRTSLCQRPYANFEALKPLGLRNDIENTKIRSEIRSKGDLIGV
jgi:hypothetical protein